MVEVISDNSKIKSVLDNTKRIIEGQGGYISPKASIVDNGGNLSVFCDPPDSENDKDTVFRLPHSCLVPIYEFDLDIIDNKMEIITSRDATAIHRELIENMVTLYNITDKIRLHKESCIWMGPKDIDEVLRYLLKGREPEEYQKLWKQFEKDRHSNQFLIETYFKSRILACRTSQNPEVEPTHVVMPLVDLINHHLMGANFDNYFDDDHKGHLFVKRASPFPDSNEVFAVYNKLDPVDSFLRYGFFDQTTPIMKSIPLEIELDEGAGTVKIHTVDNLVKVTDIPEHLRDLHFYMPRINADYKNKHVAMSHLYIPNPKKAPHALKRILFLSLRMMHPNMDKEEILQKHLPKVEKIILTENQKYYEGLLKLMERTPQSIAPYTLDIEKMAQNHLKKVNNYSELTKNR